MSLVFSLVCQGSLPRLGERSIQEPEYPAPEFFLTYNGEFSILHSSKSEFLSNISLISGAGLNGGVMTAVYSATKSGICSFSMAIAKEMAPHGINVNCVPPGPAITGFAKNAPPGMLEEFAKSITLGRLTEQQDIANSMAFLASDVYADIVGQAIIVTGNVSVLWREGE
jgi:NAD(P)-dependent dehydrogenase (short-subunit alcohol dehydrogenase family)